MTSRCALMATLALVLVAPPVAAQSWKGPAALRLEVSAYRGGPVVGAQVVIRTARQGSSGGPPPSYTDARGEVEIGGLVAGDWRVEVVHPDHMTFVATVRLSPADKPVALSTAHQAGEGSGGPLKVRLQKPRGRDVGSATPPAWAQGRTAPVDEPSAVATAPVAPAPAPAPSQPVAEAPVPAVASPEPPAPQPVSPEPVAPVPVAPAPTPEPVAPPPAAPEPAAPAPAAPEPATLEAGAAEPAAAPAAAPEPAPTPEPPVGEPTAPSEPPAPVLPSFDPGRYVRAAGPGGCLDCKPGEWSVAVEVRAAAQDSPGCAGARARGEALAAAAEGWDLAAYAGPAVAPDAPWPSVEAGTGSCVLVAVAIPAGARFLGYGFGARDASGSGGCLPRQECGIGQARWDADPRTAAIGGAKVFWAVFENLAAVERFAELKIWFAPPTKEWRPSAPTR